MANQNVPVMGRANIDSGDRISSFQRRIYRNQRLKGSGIFALMFPKIRKKVLMSEDAVDFSYRTRPSYQTFYTQINNGAGYVAGDLTLTVDDSSIFRDGQVVRDITTGEQMMVDGSPPTSTTVLMKRGSDYNGGSAAGNIADDDYLECISLSIHQNQSYVDTLYPQPVARTGKAGYVFDNYALNETGWATTTLYGEVLPDEQLLCEERFLDLLDTTCIFSKAMDITTGNTPRSTPTGLLSIIDSLSPAANVNTNLASFSMATYSSSVAPNIFASTTKQLALCGAGWLTKFQEAALKNSATTMPMTAGRTSWGADVTRHVDALGTLDMLHYQRMDKMANGFYTDYMFVFNWDDIMLFHPKGFANLLINKRQKDRESNNRIKVAREYVANFGLGLSQPDLHGYFKITSVA